MPHDAHEAFAFTKGALQAPTLARIEHAAERFDEELHALLSNQRNVEARARRYEKIMGRRPAWAS